MLARVGWTGKKVGRYEWHCPCRCCGGSDRFRILSGPDGYISGGPRSKTTYAKPLDVRCLGGCDILDVARIVMPRQSRVRVTD